jgi:hypothetical protein
MFPSRGNIEERLESMVSPALRKDVHGVVLRAKSVRPTVREIAVGRESVRDKRGSAVSSTALLPMKTGGGLHIFRRGIPAAWRPESRRGREGKGEEGEGLYRRGLDGNYSQNEEGRDIRGALLETERERGLRGSDDRWGLHGGE